MKTRGEVLLGCLLAAGAAIALSGSAWALPTVIATETFTITSDDCSPASGGGTCLTGLTNGGTVTVTQFSDGTLAFDVALNPTLEFVNTGFDAGFGFNLNGTPTITYSGVTTGFTPVGGSTTGPAPLPGLHMDGMGYFEYGLDCTGCGNGGSNPVAGPLDFTISASTNLTLASLVQNSSNQFFGIDVINTTTGATGGVDVSNGGVIVPPQEEIPEPAILSLLGIGLLGIGLTTLRRRS